jgi:hypothetical protein
MAFVSLQGIEWIRLIREGLTNVLLESLVAPSGRWEVLHLAWKANRRDDRLLLREKSRGIGEFRWWRDVLFFVLLLLDALLLIEAPITLSSGWFVLQSEA